MRPLASEAQQQLDDLVTRRQLVDILTAERNRMALLRGKAQANVEGHIEWLTEQIKRTRRRDRSPNSSLPTVATHSRIGSERARCGKSPGFHAGLCLAGMGAS